MADGNLPAHADQHVQAERDHRVDHDASEDVIAVIAEPERKADQHEQGDECCDVSGRHTHTFFAIRRVKSPCGRIMSTAMMIPNAKVSLNAEETKAPNRFSMTPITRQPMTAPGRLLKPPRIAPANAFSSTANIISKSRNVRGATRSPETTLIADASPQATSDTRPTSTPISWAARRFMLAARIAMPARVYSKK